ncbi:MAG: hypothetical protein ACRD2X_00760, partial [Vicinamibacteraceae bacterium]
MTQRLRLFLCGDVRLLLVREALFNDLMLDNPALQLGIIRASWLEKSAGSRPEAGRACSHTPEGERMSLELTSCPRDPTSHQPRRRSNNEHSRISSRPPLR